MDMEKLADEVAARVRVCPTCDGTDETWDEESGTPFCPECDDEMYSLPESIALAVLKEAEKHRPVTTVAP